MTALDLLTKLKSILAALKTGDLDGIGNLEEIVAGLAGFAPEGAAVHHILTAVQHKDASAVVAGIGEFCTLLAPHLKAATAEEQHQVLSRLVDAITAVSPLAANAACPETGGCNKAKCCGLAEDCAALVAVLEPHGQFAAAPGEAKALPPGFWAALLPLLLSLIQTFIKPAPTPA